ncbi:predicted protein [Naegleria gruberi]|uniref:Predicted protein n=1 Tax=Naegleria gruberi TaxID=5762 RepID=D2VW44_NAEGR|nr:uncharacterized protein NAEGRDRAFT_73244 [Naegleria gruberi]EFC39013.1 predicted protein [Naegleria gruberi]|eukprot:XP_002671757.1 predicted protein [Naegleria gruberi strain NEG-M]
MPSFEYLLARAIFPLAVFFYVVYQWLKQLCSSCDRYGTLYDEVEDTSAAQLSNESRLWNLLLRRRNLKRNSVVDYRMETRIQKNRFYPKLDDSWFGCAEKVEKIEKLRDSYWITMKNCEKRGKVMLFAHGGGFISGNPLGLDAQSIMYGIEQVNKTSKVKCSHILSIEYRLVEDPAHHENMDRRMLTHSLTDQLEDCKECFKYLIEEKGIPAQDIILTGFSAGACHLTMMAFQLMNYGDLKVWPVHSIALFSPPCDTSAKIVTKEEWKEENVIVLTRDMMELIDRCISESDRDNFSILSNMQQLESQDSEMYSKFFKSKWIINYSKHEEMAPGMEYFVKLLNSKVSNVNKDKLVVITEDYQFHCYPVVHCLIPESRRTMISVLQQCLNQ